MADCYNELIYSFLLKHQCRRGISNTIAKHGPTHTHTHTCPSFGSLGVKGGGTKPPRVGVWQCRSSVLLQLHYTGCPLHHMMMARHAPFLGGVSGQDRLPTVSRAELQLPLLCGAPFLGGASLRIASIATSNGRAVEIGPLDMGW